MFIKLETGMLNSIGDLYLSELSIAREVFNLNKVSEEQEFNVGGLYSRKRELPERREVI